MIGQGVYTLTEVSKFTKVAPATLRAWFMPRADGKGAGPIFKSEWDRVEGDFAVSFVNLIEAYAASIFKKMRVKHSEIRRANEILAEELATEHPFAHSDLSVHLRRIIAEKKATERKFVDVISRQLVFPQFSKALVTVDYSPANKLANTWRIAEGVALNPKVNFGKPAVVRTGISTLVIAKQYVANNRNASLVAKLFNIPENGVLNAFNFEREFRRVAA